VSIGVSVARDSLCWKENNMVEILLGQLLRRAEELDAAYTTNEAAFAAYKRAEQQQNMTPSATNNHALVETQAQWDQSRDEIVNRAQYLMGTLSLVMACKPYSTHPALIKQSTFIKEAFYTEAVTFNHYSRIADGSQESWQKWQDARGEIISRSRPLIDLVKTITLPIFESSTPTEVGK
jgi:hypothetical protein